jgi:hypothetical protein
MRSIQKATVSQCANCTFGFVDGDDLGSKGAFSVIDLVSQPT